MNNAFPEPIAFFLEILANHLRYCRTNQIRVRFRYKYPLRSKSFAVNVGKLSREDVYGMAMTHFRRKSPYVQVKTKANEETIVHIRQFVHTDDSYNSPLRESTDGVMMTLMQFRSLMFHLRALDAQFTQREPLVTDANENKVAIGMKRSWNEMTDNVPSHENALSSNVHEQQQTNDVEETNNAVVNLIADQAWQDLDDLLTSANLIKNDEPEPSIEPSYVPIPCETLSQLDVRAELAIVFAQEVMPMLKLIAMELCEGCKNVLDVDTHAHMHDACKLSQRARIDKFLKAALLRVDVQNVQSRVRVRLQCRNAVYNEKWVNEDIHALMGSKKWMKQVTTKANNM